MSKRLSVTGKAFFPLKTGARIWVEVFLIFCAVFQQKKSLSISEFLYGNSIKSRLLSSSLYQELLHTGMESSTQPCTELPPTPTRDQSQQSSWVWDFVFFLPPAGRKPGTPFPTVFSLKAGKPHDDAGDIWRQELISALPSTSVSQRKEKSKTFAFQLLISSLFCCSHWHCANARIHIHHLKGS